MNITTQEVIREMIKRHTENWRETKLAQNTHDMVQIFSFKCFLLQKALSADDNLVQCSQCSIVHY